MDGQSFVVIQQKIADGLVAAPPPLTRRDVYVPALPGKALAVIGMRRAGKTYFMWQCLADRLAAGEPRAALLYFNFEDERLAGMQAVDLQHLLEAYYRLHPEWRDQRRVTFFLDEIQGAEIGYIRTPAGYEVDFHARLPDGASWLLQVCATAAAPETLDREVRALVDAVAIYPDATPLLLTLDSLPPPLPLPAPLRWQPAVAWLLGEPLDA